MARKKAVKSTTRSRAGKTTSKKQSGGLLDYFRFGESYTSLVLGIIVVILAVILLAALFRNRDFSGVAPNNQPIKDTSSISTGPKETTGSQGTYIVKEGDTLWSIAEITYNDGYRWVEIAKVNNLSSADEIAVGVTLTLPENVAPTKAEVVSPSQSQSPPPVADRISGSVYTIKKDDTLWDISIRRYGNGYRWPEIARANNLANPDLIYAGNSLKLPQ